MEGTDCGEVRLAVLGDGAGEGDGGGRDHLAREKTFPRRWRMEGYLECGAGWSDGGHNAVTCAWRCLVMELGKAVVVGATTSLEKNFPPALDGGATWRNGADGGHRVAWRGPA